MNPFFWTMVYTCLAFLRPQEWYEAGGIFSSGPVVMIVGIFAWICYLAEASGRRAFQLQNVPQVWFLVALFFVTPIYHIIDTNFTATQETLLLVGNICQYAIILGIVLDRPSRLQKMAALLVTIAILISVHMIMQIHLGHGFGGQTAVHRGREAGMDWRPRYFGIYGDPNDVAQLLLACLPLSLVVFYKKSILRIAVVAVAIGIILYGLYLTDSRGGMLGLAALGVLLPVVWLRGKKRVVSLVVGCVIIFIGSAIALAWAGMDVSLAGRLDYWGACNDLFKSHPLFGVGFNMTAERIEGQAAHNAFVNTYTDVGLVGYLVWFGMIYFSVIGCYKVLDLIPESVEDAYLRRMGGLFFCFMVAFLVSSYFLSRGYVYPLFMLIGFSTGLIRVVNNKIPAGGTKIFSDIRMMMLFWPIATLSSFVFIYISMRVIRLVAW